MLQVDANIFKMGKKCLFLLSIFMDISSVPSSNNSLVLLKMMVYGILRDMQSLS